MLINEQAGVPNLIYEILSLVALFNVRPSVKQHNVSPYGMTCNNGSSPDNPMALRPLWSKSQIRT